MDVTCTYYILHITFGVILLNMKWVYNTCTNIIHRYNNKNPYYLSNTNSIALALQWVLRCHSVLLKFFYLPTDTP